MGALHPIRNPLFEKEMTVTQNPSTISEIDEIELTAAYGTALAITGKRQPAIRGQRPVAHAEAPEIPALERK